MCSALRRSTGAPVTPAVLVKTGVRPLEHRPLPAHATGRLTIILAWHMCAGAQLPHALFLIFRFFL